MKKKLLIFGPIGDFGGRELETGFIADSLSSKYDINVCTSSSLTSKSQLFDFNNDLIAFSINDLIYNKFYSIKILSFFSYLKNKKKGVKSNYANNGVAKKYFNYNKKRLTVIKELLPKYDLIFICAQFSTALMDVVIKIAKQNNIKIVFRTTGTIGFSDYDFINSVDCFIHHSFSNANNVQKDKMHNYVIIDQCAFIEAKLLSLKHRSGFTNFLMIGRISPEKGFEEAIDFFIKCRRETDKLHIVGDGGLKTVLELKYADLNYIEFYGHIKSDDLLHFYDKSDCIIIPSKEESGPLVGIEAMAAGKLMISTKVGAMPERLKDTLNDFWFEIDNFSSFQLQFERFKRLDSLSYQEISTSLRYIYTENYTIDVLSKMYINAIKKVI